MSAPVVESLASESGWQRFRRDRAAVWSGWFLIAVTAVCFLSPWISPYPYMAQDLAHSAAAPSFAHWLGTDLLGRDVLSRLLQGGMISLFVGLIATAVALAVGICYGVLAAEVGGRAEDAMMRFVDIVSTLPLTLIVILCTVVFGQNMPMIFLAVGGVSWLTMARIIRNQTREMKSSQFVQAAESLGQTRWGHFPPALPAQPRRHHRRVRDPDRPRSHAPRGLRQLPGARREGSDDLLGPDDQGGGRHHGGVPLATHLSLGRLRAHATFSELPR
jgi:ABC-type dipeptide/oligopeptide/nickel transport system permease subunit